MPTFPKDDNGNVRVDFVYGNVPLQPNEGRDADINEIIDPNGIGNVGWSGSKTYDSANLPVTTFAYLSKGDQNYDAGTNPDTRTVEVPTIHDVATTGYGNFPAYTPNYAGNGDDSLEVVVPTIVGLLWSEALSVLNASGFTPSSGSSTSWTSIAQDNVVLNQTPAAGSLVSSTSITVVLGQAPTVPNLVDFDTLEAAQAFLEDRGLVLGNSYSSQVGATSQNNGWIKSQSIAPNTKVNAGTAVDLTTYHYVLQPPVNPPSTTGPIAGFDRNATNSGDGNLNGNESIMYVLGRTVKPTVGDTISVTNSSDASHNTTWTVLSVNNNDSYNTGGTAVEVALVSGFITSNTSQGGTWTKI